jgi:hypothetical protein
MRLPMINNLRTALTSAVNIGDTVVNVVSTTGWPTSGIFSVDEEIIAYTGVTATSFTGCTRGQDGTTDAAHALLDTLSLPNRVSLRITAKHLLDASFLNAAPSTVSVGGIPAGTTFPNGSTVQELFQQMLYPYQPPAFTSFGISGQPNPVEVGYTIPASITFTWSTSQPANVQANSIDLIDVTGGNLVLASGLANDGNEPVVMGGPIQKTTNTGHQFKIQGVNTQAGGFNTTLTISWRWRLYFGAQAAATLNAAQILALASNYLATGYGGTFAMAAGGFKYICLSDVNGGQINIVKDQSTGFSVPMATASDDPAYSNVDGGGFSFALVSVTNAEGVTSNVRVYRTRNVLGGAVTLILT